MRAHLPALPLTALPNPAQERYVVGPDAVVGTRAALLPGSRVEAGGAIGALELSMKPMAGLGDLAA